MKHRPAPAFQLYPRDELLNSKLNKMSDSEYRIFDTLRKYYWIDGWLPNDLGELADKCRRTKRQMEAAWPAVKAMFRMTKNGHLEIPELKLQRKTHEEFHKKRGEIAKKAAQKRWNNNKLDASSMPEECLLSSSSSSYSPSGITPSLRSGVEESPSDSCAEPTKKRRSTPEPVGPFYDLAFPLNDGTEYSPPLSLVAKWRELYPAVDVDQTLRDICGWDIANKKKRKTRDVMPQHIDGWLKREQNKAHGNGNGHLSPPDPVSEARPARVEAMRKNGFTERIEREIAGLDIRALMDKRKELLREMCNAHGVEYDMVAYSIACDLDAEKRTAS